MYNTITLQQDRFGDWWVWLGNNPGFDPDQLKLFRPDLGWMYEGRWRTEIHGPFPTEQTAFEETLCESLPGGA